MLLTSLIYDMSLVSRIQGQLDQLVRVFSRRASSGISNRAMSVIIYYALCRLVHPSGLTLGEELAEIVPSRLGTQPLSRRLRMHWFLSSIALPVMTDAIIPAIKDITKWSPSTTTLVHALSTLLSDGWFLLSPRATATSLLESVSRPRGFDPLVLNTQSQLNFPTYLLPLAGCVVIAKSLSELHSLISRHVSPKPIVQPRQDDEIVLFSGKEIVVSDALGACSICMSDIRAPTATVCGHIFCWECITEWTSEDGNPCPTCRTTSLPQDLLPLVQYAPSGGEWKPFWHKPMLLGKCDIHSFRQ